MKRTATFSEEQLARSFAQAEEQLERRLDEWPRPHLAAPGDGARDVFEIDLDRGGAGDELKQPGARHVALWFHGRDLFGTRAAITAAIDARLAVDPFATLDVVLCPRAAFPLDLLTMLRAKLESAASSYLSRTLSLRGENAMRRLTVVLQRAVPFRADWIEALEAEVAVFRDVTVEEALAADDASALRIELGTAPTEAELSTLFSAYGADAISFEDRALERTSLRRTLHG